MAPAETCKIVKVIAQIADLDIQDGSYFGAFGEELATIARDERDARTMLRNIAPEPDCAKFHERIGNAVIGTRSEEHTSELQSLMRISYAVFCLKKKNIRSSVKQPSMKTTQ